MVDGHSIIWTVSIPSEVSKLSSRNENELNKCVRVHMYVTELLHFPQLTLMLYEPVIFMMKSRTA